MSTDQKQLFLEEWKKQYLKDAEISELSFDSNDIIDKDKLSYNIDAYDTDLAIGQIRILSPSRVEYSSHVPYIAILGQWSDSSWLVAPFSRFSVPAVKGEMLTGLDFIFWSVIQSWNARIIPTILLQASWKCGTLPEHVRIDAYDLFRNLSTNTPLMDTFRSAVGPALTDPLDIRNVYLQEEKEQFAPLDHAINMIQNCMFSQMPPNSDFSSYGVQRQAAAGDELLSTLFMQKNDGTMVFIGNAQILNFTPVKKGNEIPPFMWETETKLDCGDGSELYFVDRHSGTFIGSGKACVENDGMTLELTMTTPSANTSEIMTPADIIIIIPEP